MKSKKSSIIYINFSPYENTGKIFDYILSKYKRVLLFSFNFHRLDKTLTPSKIKYFDSAKLKSEIQLATLPVPSAFMMVLLPLRIVVIFFQISFYALIFSRKYGSFHTYFTVNAYTAWIGVILKKFGLARKTIFWVWDFYPPLDKNFLIMLMRWTYWLFDKISTTTVDKAIYLNNRLIEMRKSIGVLPPDYSGTIVPIGTNPMNIHKTKHSDVIRVGFIGVLKKSQGLSLIIETFSKLQNTHPNITLEIVGSGPDEKYFHELAKKKSLSFIWHGYIKEENNNIEHIVSGWKIGLAPFVPGYNTVAYYGDPSKIKLYLSCGLPVISTNVFEFSSEIPLNDAGILIPYKKEDLEKAMLTILSNHSQYSKGAKKLARKYAYQTIYDKLFV